MPALPALLLSTYVFIPLLTMAPHPFGWADAPTTLRMGENMAGTVRCNLVRQSSPRFTSVCFQPPFWMISLCADVANVWRWLWHERTPTA